MHLKSPQAKLVANRHPKRRQTHNPSLPQHELQSRDGAPDDHTLQDTNQPARVAFVIHDDLPDEQHPQRHRAHRRTASLARAPEERTLHDDDDRKAPVPRGALRLHEAASSLGPGLSPRRFVGAGLGGPAAAQDQQPRQDDGADDANFDTSQIRRHDCGHSNGNDKYHVPLEDAKPAAETDADVEPLRPLVRLVVRGKAYLTPCPQNALSLWPTNG
mmetsp:Transcript_85949/g.276466  ORF Transcript_85949/g.276466 Transcript_85949/m.276466 type:complete len:216 (+) Transcript_85949:1082-1729(+)